MCNYFFFFVLQEGNYQMKCPTEKSVATFNVKVGPFALSVNGDVGESIV